MFRKIHDGLEEKKSECVLKHIATTTERVLMLCSVMPRFRAAINKEFNKKVSIDYLVKRGFLSVDMTKSFDSFGTKRYSTTTEGAAWLIKRLQQKMRTQDTKSAAKRRRSD